LSAISSAWRRLPWWVEPVAIVVALTAFGLYSLVVVGTQTGEYREYLSPFFSPPLPRPDWIPGFITAPMFVLWIPLGFRATCYYYRKAYYRSFFWDPPACRVEAQEHDRPWSDNPAGYKGERALFMLNNVHRYFLYGSLVVVVFLWYDTIFTFFPGGSFGVKVGSLLWLANVVLVSAYTFSCHSLRHLIGGNKDCYTCLRGGNARRRVYNGVTKLNLRHPQWAWFSMISLLLTDVYFRLISAGVIPDLTIIG
jgi:hypothetical protein